MKALMLLVVVGCVIFAAYHFMRAPSEKYPPGLNHNPQVGMSVEQLRRVTGEPLIDRQSQTGSDNEATWIYADGWKVTIHGGEVTQIEKVDVNQEAADKSAK